MSAGARLTRREVKRAFEVMTSTSVSSWLARRPGMSRRSVGSSSRTATRLRFIAIGCSAPRKTPRTWRRRRCCGRGERWNAMSPERSFRRGFIGSRRTRAWTSSSGGRAGRRRSIRSQTGRRTRRLRRRMTLLRVTRSGRGWSWRCCARSRSCRAGSARYSYFATCSVGPRPRSPRSWSPPSRRSTARCSARAARSTQRLPETTQTAAEPTERELLNRYVAAFEHADMDGLVALLREDATLRMPPQPSMSGGLRIARFFLETVARRRSDAHTTQTDLGEWPARGDDRSASARRPLDPARDQRARDRGGQDRRDRRVSRPDPGAAVRCPGMRVVPCRRVPRITTPS